MTPVEMIHLFQLVDRPDSKNIIVEQIHGIESYRIAEDGEDLTTKTVLRGKETTFGAITRSSQNHFVIASISEGPTLIFESIKYINKPNNQLIFMNDETLTLKDGTIIFFKSTNLFFAQLPKYSLINEETYYGVCFNMDTVYFDSSSKILKHAPTLSYSFLPVKFTEDLEKQLKELGPVRLVLHPDAFNESNSWPPEDVKNKYEFELFSVESHGKYWISKKIEKFDEIFFSNEFEFKNRIISLLHMKENKQEIIKYDFSKDYHGWNYVVFPFVDYIDGISTINGKFVGIKFSHLSQSSGYGKTRLCFEALKHFGRGIYCVYRSTNHGHPQTTPWFENLFSDFKSSKSDQNSIGLCRAFIKNSIESFNDFEKCGGTEEVMKMFEGKITAPDFSSSSGAISSSNFVESVRNQCNNCFPIIIDECNELLITPLNLKSGLTLYQALKRALYEIREYPVVAIFLGTKSSLGDFIFDQASKISTRKYGEDSVNGFIIPLYIFTQCIDIMLSESFRINYEEILADPLVLNNVSIITSAEFIKFSTKCGRPLWTYFESSLKEVYEIAKIKLQTEKSLYELTALIMRTGSSVVPHDNLAHELVLSGMATLLHVDVEGSRCWMEYVPEPVLSNSARNSLLLIDKYAKSINEYVKRLKLGTFHDTGSAGELVGRIVLLRAMDLALLRPGENVAVGPESNAVIVSEIDLFGKADEDCKKCFSQKCSEIATASPFKSRVNESESGYKYYYSPKFGITTLREYLMMLTIEEPIDLVNFGVSDAVLDGLVSLNQFIHIDNPLIINQAYLMHGFARSVGFILPPRSPGIDLVIPVLRSDNRMSCIAIQVKNYATDVFPSTPEEINRKLSAEYLKFLDFGKIGEFEAVPWDDFVRIVFQFREKKEFENEPNSYSIWVTIPASKSNNEHEENCNSLWFLALDFFEDSLFFNHAGIIKDLNTILSGQRDFLTAIEFPKVLLPTPLQTSEIGARFLTNSARPLSNYQNIVIEDQTLRSESEIIYANYLKLLEKLHIPKNAKEFKEKFKITTAPKISEVKDETNEEGSLGTDTKLSSESQGSQGSQSSQGSQRSQSSQSSQGSQNSKNSQISQTSKMSIEKEKSETVCTDLDDDEIIKYKSSVLAATRMENSAYQNIDNQAPKIKDLNDFSKSINDFKIKYHEQCIEKRNSAFLQYKKEMNPKNNGEKSQESSKKRSADEAETTENRRTSKRVTRSQFKKE